MKYNIHQQHFKNAKELENVRRYVQITAQYINLFIPADAAVLDVGGADGVIQDYINGHCTSIDIHPMADRVKMETIYDQPVDAFDVIIYNHVLEHICKDYEELERAVKSLKKDGILFIATPFFSSPWAWNLDGHVRLYNEEIFNKILSSLDMKVLEYSLHSFRDNKIEQWMVAKKK